MVGDQGSDYQRSLIFPGAFRMLAVKKGDRVLDLACGPGAFSRYMSKKGMRVEGLDASEQLLSYAAARSPAFPDACWPEKVGAQKTVRATP